MTPLNKETIDGILELAGGDDSILVELFESFLQDAKELSEGISLSVSKSNWDKLKFDVHSLKGLCGTIGANPLYEVCKELFEEVSKERFHNLKPLVSQIEKQYTELVSYIKSNYDIKHEA